MNGSAGVAPVLVSVEFDGKLESWLEVGFVAGPSGAVTFGNGAVTFGETPLLRVRNLPSGSESAILDGLAVGLGLPDGPSDHPNGSSALDHLVIGTDSLERTSAAVHDVLGLELLRVRRAASVRQGFHRFPTGDRSGCVIEVVESPHARRTELYGLVVITSDLDGMCSGLGPDVIGVPKDAVQPGRQIATFRSSAGLGIAVAMMTPEPRRRDASF